MNMSTWRARLMVLASLVLALAGCDGGDDLSAASPAAAAAQIFAAAGPKTPKGTLGAATDTRRRALANGSITTEQLLSWAETQYPMLFPSTQSSFPLASAGLNFTVRFYSITGNYTGVATDGTVYAYGPFNGFQLISYGTLETFKCQVAPQLCGGGGPYKLGCDSPPAGKRDKCQQPFASSSFWNAAIAKGASLSAAPVSVPASAVFIDPVYVLNAADASANNATIALRQLSADAFSGSPRCGAQSSLVRTLQFPLDRTIPDVSQLHTPNNNIAVLQRSADAANVIEGNAACRSGRTVNDALYVATTDVLDIYGDGHGTAGGHGGSGLSTLGGVIRKGELATGVRHALKITIYGWENLGKRSRPGYRTSGGCVDSEGHTWPAIREDATFCRDRTDVGTRNENFYGFDNALLGKVPLYMGSLVAVPENAFCERRCLGQNCTAGPLMSDTGRSICRALRDYGAYVADNSAWRAFGLAIEKDAIDDLVKTYRLTGPAQGDFKFDWTDVPTLALIDDILWLASQLHRVEGNTPTTVGGGAAGAERRASAVPEIGN